MKTAVELKSTLERSSSIFFVIKYISGTFILFSLAFILLRFPENSAQGVKNGINLCLDILIPTMYPFMILTNIFVNSGLISRNIALISKITHFIFRLPAECASVIFFSMIGGLPIGAKMTQGLYNRGVLTKEQGQRMLYFCINPGPAFVISSVGYYMLGSKEIGVIIFMSLIASSLTLAFITRFIDNSTEITYIKSEKNVENKNVFQMSVTDASKSILSVCSWVVAFSCISEIINQFNASETSKIFLQCITEMTNGCKVASKYFAAPIITGIIGFGGICAHFQLMDSIAAFKMKYKYFLVGRIINGSIATVYCSFLLKWFPLANETFSAGVKPEENGISAPLFTSVLMIVMAVLFIIGDDYSVKRKKNKKRNI